MITLPSPPPDLLSKRLLSNVLDRDASLQHCVCYGLGNFASCVSARYQLAMLLLLLETLQVFNFHLYDMICPIKHCIFNAIKCFMLSQIPVSSCSVYDPVFSASECDALKELGFTVLTENEVCVTHSFSIILFCSQFIASFSLQEGKRPVYQPTLFYLMHCGKALYNNLLWRNWTPQTLQNIIIIGNRFHGIQER